MAKTKRVKIEGTITAHEGELREVVLREPTYDDIMDVGTPYTVHDTEGADGVVIYNHSAIRHYVESCVVSPKDPLMLSQLGMTDTFAVRRAMLDFFLPGAVAGAGSNTSQPTSDVSVSSPTPSAA